MSISAEKRAYWEQHLNTWKNSGLTQKDYCKREGLTYGSFKSWRSQLIDKNDLPAPRFVEATPVESEKPSHNALVLQISLANGSRIGVTGQASSDVVRQVLELTGKIS
tara:strand:- start:1006 stop:1329 length:324 start_codon:yes stop_codon:yes gene_type:complete